MHTLFYWANLCFVAKKFTSFDHFFDKISCTPGVKIWSLWILVTCGYTHSAQISSNSWVIGWFVYFWSLSNKITWIAMSKTRLQISNSQQHGDNGVGKTKTTYTSTPLSWVPQICQKCVNTSPQENLESFWSSRDYIVLKIHRHFIQMHLKCDAHSLMEITGIILYNWLRRRTSLEEKLFLVVIISVERVVAG